jgi:hypothetical protein
MSSTSALSSLNAETETYPLLTVAQIDRLRPFGRLSNRASVVLPTCVRFLNDAQLRLIPKY